MDNIRPFFVGLGYKNPGDELSTTHHFAEVVVISNSHQALNPLLFLMKQNGVERFDFSEAPNEKISLDDSSFAMAGEVVHIDKKKKLITLSSRQTVSYNYLILANGTEKICISTRSNGIASGVQILIHALKIKKISPDLKANQSAFAALRNPKFMAVDSAETHLPAEIQKLLFHENSTDALSSKVKKCLYEVVM